MITRRNFLKMLGLGALIPFLPKVKAIEELPKPEVTHRPPDAKTFSEYIRMIKNDTSSSWVGTIYPITLEHNNYYNDGKTSFSVNGYHPNEVARWQIALAMAEDLDRKFMEEL